MPENDIANILIKLSDVPIAAPSANVSGRPSGTNLSDIKEELDSKVDAMIDGGNTKVGIESTVVKVVENVPTILRPGKVTVEDITEVIGTCKINDKVMSKVEDEEIAESPGMKHKHYAPKTKCVLVYDEIEEKQIEKIKRLIKENKDVCVLGFIEHRESINTEKFISLGSKSDLEEISKNIFSALRKADKLNTSLVIIEGTRKQGLGLAIMNRLIRTCEYEVY